MSKNLARKVGRKIEKKLGKKLVKKLGGNHTWELVLSFVLCVASIVSAGLFLKKAIESARRRTYHAVFAAVWTVTAAVYAFLGFEKYWKISSADGRED